MTEESAPAKQAQQAAGGGPHVGAGRDQGRQQRCVGLVREMPVKYQSAHLLRHGFVDNAVMKSVISAALGVA